MALVAIHVFRLGIVAKCVLAAQFLGDSGEGLRQLRGVIGLVEPAAGFICQRVQVLIRSIVVGLARTRYRHASIQRSVVSLLSSSRAKGSPPGGNDGHASAAGALHRAQVISRVVLNWINERIEFFHFAQSALISGRITRGVDAVGEEHNGFTPLDFVQTLLNGEVHRVIEAGRVARVSVLFDNSFDEVHVVRGFGQEQHFIVEADNEHAILRAQLFGECDGGFFDLRKVKMGRSRSVQQQRYRKRLFCRLEIGDWLLDAIFEDTKIFAPKIGNETPLPIQHTHGHCDEGGVDPHHVSFADFFRPRRGNTIRRRITRL